MATTAFGDSTVSTSGELPAPGDKAAAFELVGNDFSAVTLPEGKRTVLNIFPSIATGVCSGSVRKFNELAAGLDNTAVICVSNDLPFALDAFCGAEGIANVTTASGFRSSFGDDYGVRMVDGKWAGLLARAVVVVDTDGSVIHAQLSPAIGQEIDYDAAVAALG
ncbi:thiol peroxidase [Nocardioides stalactiti]|uniref:thiol peroxidase n=1 Tax=Nocardioides stalactiti TaxID=2755356 RepID=UPI0016025900|nr:thiol peroxidase [Nocardioides stalactiti]